MSQVGVSTSKRTFQDKSLIFSSIAEASLDNLIFVAFQRVANAFLISRNRFSFLYKYFTEIYFITHFLCQMKYLLKHGATFSENFFGMKRTSIKNEGSMKLSNKEVALSLIYSSVFKYVLEKTKQANQHLQPKSNMNVHSFINIAYYVSAMVQYIRFLSGASDVVTLNHAAAGVKLEYTYEVASQTSNPLRELISQGLQNALGLSAFVFQFSQWWQRERNVTGRRINVPPPPVMCEFDVEQSCLLCKQAMKNATLLNTSGNVFCYECISNFVEKFKKCPITSVAVKLSNLIQLQE